MLRRVPTQADQARRQALALTPRDVDVLVAVHTHGVLTTELVELAFFPPAQGERRTPCSRAYERLRQRWLWDYLERLEPPVARTLGGRRPYLYLLGRRGVAPVAARLDEGTAPVQRRRLDRVDDLFVEHDLVAAAFWAHLMALLRSTAIREFHWTPERELRARGARARDPRTEQWLPVLPDGAFELVYPDATTQVGLLEVDMGTLTLARFRRKLRAFEAYLDQGLFERDWELRHFEVLILTQSESRLQHLRQAARTEVSEDRWGDYSFATFDVLDPSHFAGEGWVTLDGARAPLLYADAFPPEPDEGPGDDAADAGLAPTAPLGDPFGETGPRRGWG